MQDPTPTGEAPTAAARTTRRRALAAVALCAVAYLYVSPHYPQINNPNENVRLYMTAALATEGDYRINTLREEWGWVNDAACIDRMPDGTNRPCERRKPPGAQRDYYSVKAPGASLMGVPGYWLYTQLAETPDRPTALWVVRVTAGALPTLLFLFFLYGWLGRHTRSPALRDLVFFGTALGSVMLGYSYLFASHTQSALCAFGGFMLLYDARHADRTGLAGDFLAGLLVAGVTFYEYPGFIVSLFLSIYALFALRQPRRIALFVVGALIPTLAVMHFQWKAYGSPLTPGHLFVENPAFRAGHEEGFFGARDFHWEAALRLLLDRRLGLFGTSPLLLLALPGLVLLARRAGQRLDAWIVIGLSLTLYVFICFMNLWDGGWAIGPRYLVPLIPFLAWAALVFLDRVAERRPRLALALALGGVAGGLIAAGIPSVYYPHLSGAFVYPLADLFPVLVAHDFAPHNAGNLVGWYGSSSMLPLVLLAVGVLGWALWRRLDGRSLALVVGGAAAVLAAFLAFHLIAPEPTPTVRKGVAFITKTWDPKGHDVAAVLEARLKAAALEADPAEYQRLAEVYRAEGREGLARRAKTRGERLQRRQDRLQRSGASR